MTALVVPLRLVLDRAKIQEWYDDYVADVAWYRENGKLQPDHPDAGYATGVAPPFDAYAADVLAGVLDDVLGCHIGYRVERVEEAGGTTTAALRLSPVSGPNTPGERGV